MKIRPLVAELFHAGQTEKTELKVAFRNFANASKKQHTKHAFTLGRFEATRDSLQRLDVKVMFYQRI